MSTREFVAKMFYSLLRKVRFCTIRESILTAGMRKELRKYLSCLLCAIIVKTYRNKACGNMKEYKTSNNSIKASILETFRDMHYACAFARISVFTSLNNVFNDWKIFLFIQSKNTQIVYFVNLTFFMTKNLDFRLLKSDIQWEISAINGMRVLIPLEYRVKYLYRNLRYWDIVNELWKSVSQQVDHSL